MNYEVFGGFAIPRKDNRHGDFDKSFWDTVVKKKDSDLPNACGCYVFALKNGDNIVAWYVGKTEKRTFQQECFGAAQINIYNEVLVNHSGKPLLFILPRLTSAKKIFSKPTKGRYRDVEFLETLLIGMALDRNKYLTNIKKTKLLREMIVPGVINSPQARPMKAVSDLRNALGSNK
jgi:hypothetical protein